MNLMRGFFEKGYNLYCDNYYTSPQLNNNYKVDHG